MIRDTLKLIKGYINNLIAETFTGLKDLHVNRKKTPKNLRWKSTNAGGECQKYFSVGFAFVAREDCPYKRRAHDPRRNA